MTTNPTLNLQKVEICPVCGNSSSESMISCKDFTVSKAFFQIEQCVKCGFAFTSPRPDDENLGRFYESEEYISHSNKSTGIISWLYQKVRKHTLKKKLAMINKKSSKGNLLDIGCGTGEFLNVMKCDGWKTIGIEPNESARKQGKDHFQLDVRPENELQNLPENSFDVITMWHVMEHVSNLHERIQSLKHLLKNDGVLIVAVPNRNSYDAKHYKENWAAYDVPRHLWHFRPEDMRNLMSQFDFEVKQIIPMKFDSYYVSMLSEKYKTGKNRLARALWNGWISNRKAGKEGASSLIYIIRKKD